MHHLRNSGIAAVCFATLAACTGREPISDSEQSPNETVEHPFSDNIVAIEVQDTETIGGSSASWAPVTICQHAAFSTHGAGIFRVTELVGVAELIGEEVRPHTYIVLSVEEAWAGDLGEEVVVRVFGGPYGSGEFLGANLNLTVGEPFVALLRGDTPDWNEGYPSMLPNVVFKQVGEGWDFLGDIYTTEDLRSAVQAAYASFEPGEFSTAKCGVEVDFERCPEESLIPARAVRFNQPCEEDREPQPQDPALYDAGEPSEADAGMRID